MREAVALRGKQADAAQGQLIAMQGQLVTMEKQEVAMRDQVKIMKETIVSYSCVADYLSLIKTTSISKPTAKNRPPKVKQATLTSLSALIRSDNRIVLWVGPSLAKLPTKAVLNKVSSYKNQANDNEKDASHWLTLTALLTPKRG
jgi:hypothetical protein